jgi:hypothetical protein
LDECTGIGFLFPRCGRFARFEADDDIADTDGFARFHRQIAPQAVAFVKQANRCNALSHWGQGFYRGWFRRNLWRGWFWRGYCLWCRWRHSFGRFCGWLSCILQRGRGLPGKASANHQSCADDGGAAH